MLLQFGREVFFALTGFVLVYTAWNRTGASGTSGSSGFPTWRSPTWRGRASTTPTRCSGPSTCARPCRCSLRICSMAGPCTTCTSCSSPCSCIWSSLSCSPLSAAPPIGPEPFSAWWPWPTWLGWRSCSTCPRRADRPVGGGTTLTRSCLPYSMYVLAGCYAAVHLPKLQRVVARYSRALIAVAVVSAGSPRSASTLCNSLTWRRGRGQRPPAGHRLQLRVSDHPAVSARLQMGVRAPSGREDRRYPVRRLLRRLSRPPPRAAAVARPRSG